MDIGVRRLPAHLPTCPAMATLRLLAALLVTSAAFAEAASAQLLHRYSFDGSGTLAADSVGSAPGTILGGAQLNGTGTLDFDGVNDHVEFPANVLTGRDSASFEAWYTWTGGPNWQRIVDFGSNTGGAGAQGNLDTHFALTPSSSISGTPTLDVKLTNTFNTIQALGSTPLQLGTLSHIVGVIDGATQSVRLYVDGAFESETPVAGDLTMITAQNFWLGQSQFLGNPAFFGTITEFRVYGSALTDGEVAANFAAGPDVAGVMASNYCGPAPLNSAGLAGVIEATGSGVVSANALTLRASDVPTNQFGIFIVSRDQGFVPGVNGSSNGNLCLGGAIGRYLGPGGSFIQPTTGGTFSLGLDLTQIPQGGGSVSAMPGETWNFQAWHRDGVGLGSNLTDAVSVVLQ